MIVLDTNVISEVSKLDPDPNVADWLRRADPLELYLCAPVVAELSFGGHVLKLRNGSDRYLTALDALLSGGYGERFLGFDRAAALHFGRICAERAGIGRPLPVVDAMIAAICLAHGATLATRNVRDFDLPGLTLINPFEK